MVRKEEVFEITADSMLSQAVETLFVAKDKADMLNDTDGLMRIAAGWMELYEHLNGTERMEKKMPLGFTGGLRGTPEPEEEVTDDTECIADEPTED